MKITHLQNFCTTLHNTLIECEDKNKKRWLFATDGHRAIGIQTSEKTSNIENNTNAKAITISNFFHESEKLPFLPLKRQHFMTWLHSSKEKKVCLVCKDTHEVECSECDGEGKVDCDECDGRGSFSEDCTVCDGSGKIKDECDECNGTAKVAEECDNCDGTAKVAEECDNCDGSGFIDENHETKCDECNDGKVEAGCENCDDGKVEADCPCCDDGYIEADCNECDDGIIDNECNECDGSSMFECNNCSGSCMQECDECDDEGNGKIYDHIFDLELIKDLSMDFFDEIFVNPNKFSPIFFRGYNVLAVIMPMNATDFTREYLP